MNNLLIMLKIHMDNFLGKVLKNKKGQNTVEYLLMLVVIVAIVVFVGAAMKGGLGEVWETVKSKILGAVQNTN